MNLTKLETDLKALGFDVFINHTTTEDVVDDTFIVILENGSSNAVYDDKVYVKGDYYSVILHAYEEKKAKESQLENYFDINNIVWSKSQGYIEDLFLFTTQYDFKLWQL